MSRDTSTQVKGCTESNKRDTTGPSTLYGMITGSQSSRSVNDRVHDSQDSAYLSGQNDRSACQPRYYETRRYSYNRIPSRAPASSPTTTNTNRRSHTPSVGTTQTNLPLKTDSSDTSTTLRAKRKMWKRLYPSSGSSSVDSTATDVKAISRTNQSFRNGTTITFGPGTSHPKPYTTSMYTARKREILKSQIEASDDQPTKSTSSQKSMWTWRLWR